MEKYSKPEREKQDVINMSTEEKLPSLERLEKDAVIKCPRCLCLTETENYYVCEHDVYHVVCECGYEWVE